MFKGKYTAPITYALLLLICFLISNYYRILPKDVVKQAEKELHKKESIAQKGLEKLHITLQSSNNTPYTTLEKQLKPYAREEHISFYVYKNDTLCYWTSNQPAIDLVPFYTEKKSTLIHLRNGWYELLKLDKLKNSVYSCMALITIKPEYDFQNDYLKNEFVDWLYLPEGTQLKEPTLNNEAYTVKTKEGDPLFTLSDLYPNNQTYLDEISSLLFICFSILVLYVIHTFFQNNQKTFKHPLLLLSVLVVFLRFLMITFHYPDSFYALGLYSAKKFADADSFWYSFLGDILINSFLTVSLSVIIYQRPFLVFKNRLWLYLLVILGVASLHVFAFSINSLVNSLIFNSTISYNINRFYDMEALSFTALLFIAVLMLSYYFFSEKLIRLILYQKTNHFLLTAITIVLSMSFSLFILNWYNLSF